MYLGHALCMSRVFSGDAQVEYIYLMFSVSQLPPA